MEWHALSGKISSRDTWVGTPRAVNSVSENVEIVRFWKLARCTQPQLANMAASGNLKAVDMLLKLDALMDASADGEVMKGDLATGRNRGEAALDLSKLRDQELEWLEIIVRKAGPQ